MIDELKNVPILYITPRGSDLIGLGWNQASAFFQSTPGDSRVWPGLRTSNLGQQSRSSLYVVIRRGPKQNYEVLHTQLLVLVLLLPYYYYPLHHQCPLLFFFRYSFSLSFTPQCEFRQRNYLPWNICSSKFISLLWNKRLISCLKIVGKTGQKNRRVVLGGR